MKLFTWVLMGCYMTIFVLLGLGLVAFSVHWVPVEGAAFWLQTAYQDKNLRLILFLTGVGLVLLNGLIAQLTLNKLQRQKIIAFENPDGQVTVSLSAIEDFIRKSTKELSEVKDIRSDVVAGKGRILVRARVSLWSEAHIPDVTERIQMLIKSRVQEMLSGIEEPILVKIHVANIVHRQEKESPPRHREDAPAPFRGFEYGGSDIR